MSELMNEDIFSEFENIDTKSKKIEAWNRYINGEKPEMSTSITDSMTAGYGKEDSCGFWEFPLNVDQNTLKIVPWN